MSEEEINDNLIMLKYFLEQEGDENWEDYCNAIQGLLDLYEQEKNKIEALEKQHEYDMQMIDEVKGQANEWAVQLEQEKEKNKEYKIMLKRQT